MSLTRALLERAMQVGFVTGVAAFQRSPFDRPFMTVLEVVERHR
jgi:hypothetical protein